MSVSRYDLPEGFTDEEKEGHWFLHEVVGLQHRLLVRCGNAGESRIPIHASPAYEMDYGYINLYNIPVMRNHLQAVESIDPSCSVMETSPRNAWKQNHYERDTVLVIKRYPGLLCTRITMTYMEKLFLIAYHEYAMMIVLPHLPQEIAQIISSYTVCGNMSPEPWARWEHNSALKCVGCGGDPVHQKLFCEVCISDKMHIGLNCSGRVKNRYMRLRRQKQAMCHKKIRN